jgi:hypothetical protein
MASIPGVRFDITGASGSQGFLGPKSSWRTYVLPRGGYASQDSTGTIITFDSADVASRFAANNWVQVDLQTANIRQVSAVGGNSISVSGDSVTVTENQRIFIIGNTQPTVSGGSATYTTPETVIRRRDDDAADTYTNSMVTSNSDGLIQFFSDVSIYDAIVQDGNQTNQLGIVDLPVGAVEGISTNQAALFGATVTINGALGVTGWATFGSTVTMNSTLGVTGDALFDGGVGVTGWLTTGASVTITGAIGVTGTATFGDTTTIDGALGVTGTAIFGATLTANGAVGITGTLTGTSASLSNDLTIRRFLPVSGTALVTGDFALSAGWGDASSIALAFDTRDTCGRAVVSCAGSGIAANPTVTLTFTDGAYENAPFAVVSRGDSNSPTTGFWIYNGGTNSTVIFQFVGTPVTATSYTFTWIIFQAS